MLMLGALSSRCPGLAAPKLRAAAGAWRLALGAFSRFSGCWLLMLGISHLNAAPANIRLKLGTLAPGAAGEEEAGLAPGAKPPVGQSIPPVLDIPGFDKSACAEIAICAAELASNAVRHGGGGVFELRIVRGPRVGIEISCTDGGAGIHDVEASLRDGWSNGKPLDVATSRGLGTGLGSVRRMMSDLTIASAPSRGTVVTARRWRSGVR